MTGLAKIGSGEKLSFVRNQNTLETCTLSCCMCPRFDQTDTQPVHVAKDLEGGLSVAASQNEVLFFVELGS